jgi:hypothetical protein
MSAVAWDEDAADANGFGQREMSYGERLRLFGWMLGPDLAIPAMREYDERHHWAEDWRL